jgi:hypothetical protein
LVCYYTETSATSADENNEHAIMKKVNTRIAAIITDAAAG